MRIVVASAPGRCGIVGNPTDMYGGNVLSCTVRERAECRLVTGSDQFEIFNADEHAIIRSKNELELAGDKLDIARAALKYFEIDPCTNRMELHLATDIPMRAGMAGSTAMLAAIVGALNEVLNLRLNCYEIAETMRKIEARIMGVVCGFQDQHMAVFGGVNFMNFAGKQSLEQLDHEPLATIEPLQSLVGDLPLLLAHTGIQHHSGTVHASPRERWLSGETLVRNNYDKIAELGWKGKRALLKGDWNALGCLMNENHSLVAELGGSGPANDRLIEAARAAGAWGAKLAGAGGGGTILVLTDQPLKVGRELLAAGAERLLYPGPEPGLTVDTSA